jgi:hypothetical protein
MDDGFKRDLRNYPLYFLLWTVLGLFYFSQGVTQRLVAHDRTLGERRSAVATRNATCSCGQLRLIVRISLCYCLACSNAAEACSGRKHAFIVTILLLTATPHGHSRERQRRHRHLPFLPPLTMTAQSNIWTGAP